MTDILDIRRPIGARKAGWAHWSARKLADAGITPNQISMASMGFAGLGAAAFVQTAFTTDAMRAVLLVIAILGMQGRLLCNLFDGMVAIEHRSAGKDGPFWNEFPDRISDMLLLTGAGIAAGSLALGLAAAGLAVLVAYVRELGRATGLPADFGGPMAKQHRMAVLTAAAGISLAEPPLGAHGETLFGALCMIIAGSAATAFLRARRQIRSLKLK